MSKEVLKADFHVHTRGSKDSVVPPCWMVGAMSRRDLDWIAFTDHNTLSREVISLTKSGHPIILGEEILVNDFNTRGKRIEITGLFLREAIKPGQSLEATINQISDQEGLVVIPHPLELWRHGAGKSGCRRIVDLCSELDVPVALEVFNARARRSEDNLETIDFYRFFKSEGVLPIAGSDAHMLRELGRGFVVIPPFDGTRGGLTEALKQAKVGGETGLFQNILLRLASRAEVLSGRPRFI